MNAEADVLIVGAGHAGAACAIALRQGKFEGSVLIVGAEPDLPYERPPLSKDYLSGEKTFERLLIRPEKFWIERDIGFRLGTTIRAVDQCGQGLRPRPQASGGKALGRCRASRQQGNPAQGFGHLARRS